MYNLIPSNPPTFPGFMTAKREWCLVSKLAPLFQVAERNDTRFQQALLEKMFKVLGSPTPAIWPDLVHHRFYVERGGEHMACGAAWRPTVERKYEGAGSPHETASHMTH
eukprot:TRINITY_DN16361_c0_g1_i1.p2 TRINITY_DN16361_c0_g1~~TRINITY_DN16361_c0_g1_i1.p2  ORF type:complete len:109 (-),score=11.14 TRINITY_DN16361_c0_g1_i1:135-461(-)